MHDHEYLALMNSTIVRSRRPAPGLLRAGLAVLSAVAPARAAWLGERFFLTPPRPPRPAAEREILAGARKRTIEVGAGPLPVWTWGDGPPVLLVHGWGGRGTQLGAFVPPLLADGFSVVAFDGPGHGQTPPRRVTLPEMAEAVRAVAAAAGPVRAVVAHSIGALAAAVAMRDEPGPEAAVFLGAPADITGPSFTFAAGLGLSRRARDLMQARIEARVGVPWTALDLRRLAPPAPWPLLVVHDRGDGEVGWQDGVAIARAWPGAALLTTEGLGHRRILRDPTVVAAAAAFIARHVTPGRPAAPALLEALLR